MNSPLLRRYHIITYGCQMNKNDSERLSGLLENTGWTEAERAEEANLVVLNTCSVRDKAERRVLGKFHELDYLRRQNGLDMKLAMTGCMPQHLRGFVLEKLPFLDVVVGVNNMEQLPAYLAGGVPLAAQLATMRPGRKESEVASYEENLAAQKREPGKRAWVSIAFGCDKFCTYCIVPFTRGREYSRKKESILEEIRGLEGRGYTEVVLLGQNVNSYGKTTYGDYLFPDLLEEVAAFSFLEDIGFMTSHPRDVDQRLIDVIARHKNLSKEIHFPLQHGDDVVLTRMNRGYTFAEYAAKVEALRRTIPGARVGTDLIVAFPGETEAQFQKTLEAVEHLRFDWANTAAFSPRPGTKAAVMDGQIPEAEKARRLAVLNDLLDRLNPRTAPRLAPIRETETSP
ncbi:MAG: tRNA (N6-isopentenyl adenosine(37)-C2)-methylthiotransferase MiaB [Spirochaetes bacterium]|nr:tRNA (N6-isopentenyl adenosine(37)-C2)-methylthiotransferase MiaB [Spirochaetota bacterium]